MMIIRPLRRSAYKIAPAEVSCMTRPVHLFPHQKTTDDKEQLNSLLTCFLDVSGSKMGLDSQLSRVSGYPTGILSSPGSGNFFLRHRVQSFSGVHPTSYSVRAGEQFPGGKSART